MRFPLRILSVVLAAALAAARAVAQSGEAVPEAHTLVAITTPAVEIAAGGTNTAAVRLKVIPGWHINANPPALDYMIPTTVEIQGTEGITAQPAIYPAPHKQKLSFEESELLVYHDHAVVKVPLGAAANATPGKRALQGVLSFQACNDELCLPPADVPFQLEVVILPAGSAVAPGFPDEAPAPGTPTLPGEGFASVPPESVRSSAPVAGGGMGALKQLEGALAVGGLRWWLMLFVGGLLLNLTPCVFPMIGVTVSIFGARKKEASAKVFSHAAVYVLAIMVMYSALGVVAALTGTMFGSALQNTWVSVGLGGLLVLLSLSMFGLYELQPPLWVMQKLGGADTTSLLGIFVSGLGVGIIAAPCIGPFVVAVLALIAARQDVLFGLQTMAVLSFGLGAPYLVLATFSNLLQALPRSGDWMVWVKKVFGVILLGLGGFYIVLAVAPKWSTWVLPGALILGGVYLGFLEKSAATKPGFRKLKLAVGTLALLGGIAFVATTPRQGIVFHEFTSDALQAGLAGGQPALLDFTADWCVPCHELDRSTFSDQRVVRETRSFRAYKVNLTNYRSPESEALRKQFRITGVPTVVFLLPDGREVREARVEGFLPPERFLERVRIAGGGAVSAATE